MSTTTLSTDWGFFEECLLEATEAAQVGFFFEEGGCWGMALALHQALTARGHEVAFAVQEKGFMHAWVVADGSVHLDHQGRRLSLPERYQLYQDEARFREVAMQTGGCNVQDLLSDEAQAMDIVSQALREMDLVT